jgi:hypothetical protein
VSVAVKEGTGLRVIASGMNRTGNLGGEES